MPVVLVVLAMLVALVVQVRVQILGALLPMPVLVLLLALAAVLVLQELPVLVQMLQWVLTFVLFLVLALLLVLAGVLALAARLNGRGLAVASGRTQAMRKGGMSTAKPCSRWKHARTGRAAQTRTMPTLSGAVLMFGRSRNTSACRRSRGRLPLFSQSLQVRLLCNLLRRPSLQRR